MSTPDVEWFDAPIGEAVEIHDSAEEWAMLGRGWERRIEDALVPLRVRVDHVGSTSVPGLAAKPVIDLQIQVPDLKDEAAYIPALTGLGMVLRARGADFRFLRPPAGSERNVHIHVCETGSVWAAEHLAFRDALRHNPDIASEYELLKRQLADTVVERADYNSGKASFIQRVVSAYSSQKPPITPQL